MDNIKRLDRTLVQQGAWISFYRDTMAFANGNTAKWDFIHHNGAAAMIAEEDGKIVMIRQYRPGAEGEILELPAGGINPGEDPMVAAMRELREETGRLCETAAELIMIQPSPAYNDEKVFIYSCDVSGVTDIEPDENEYISIECFTLDALIDMILSGKINDSKTVAGLLAYREAKARQKK